MPTWPSSSAKAGLTNTPELAEVVVVDASVLVELVVDGRHARGADTLLSRYAASQHLTLITAAHGLVEAANALRKLIFRGQLAQEDGLRAIGELAALDLVLDTTAARLRRIWSLRDRMSAYDAAYATVADELRVPLVTIDERLLRACRDVDIPAIGLDDFAAAG